MDHTPGPWGVEPGGEIRVFGANYEVARASDLPSSFGKDGYGDCGLLEQKANARLIAAAPDCYNELKSLVSWIRDDEDLSTRFDRQLRNAEKAIAKV